MLTVLCADLLLDPDSTAAWPPAITQRLARARVLSKSHDSDPIPLLTPAEAWLKRRFSLPNDPALTVSAYQRYCYGAQPEAIAAGSQILTATPAYLHATMDHLVLNSASELAIDSVEAESLAASANEFFAADGLELQILAPECWLLILSKPLVLSLRGSLQASGRNVHAYMPAGQDGRRLRALLNEIQMLWHEHPVNQHRADNRQMPINSLWIEGTVSAGKAPAAAVFKRVISDSLVVRGLAIGNGIDDTTALPPQGVGTADIQPETLIELAGADALAQLGTLLDASPQPVEIVLCDQRNRLELLSHPRDKYCFWRSNALTVPTVSAT